MEIDRTAAARTQRTTPIPPTPTPGASERDASEAHPTRIDDRIELSDAARELGGEPDATREAAIAALRAEVDAGTYRVDADGVAGRIAASGDL